MAAPKAGGKLTKVARGQMIVKREPFRIGAFELSDNWIEVHGRPSLSEYQGCLDFVDRTHKAAGWWLVDLIAYADSRDDWKQSLDAIIDSDICSENTAKQYRYIKKNVPQRIEGVPFGHHAIVASLEPKEQIEWLEKSRDEGWTQRELQVSIRAASRTKIISGQARLEGQYRVIMADCPWTYNDSGPTVDGSLGKAERHYPGMTIAELCALPVAAHAMKDAVLGFWITAPLLLQNPGPREVIEAWGFEYKAHLVWDKVLGMPGHYSHVTHELFCFCTRGSGAPEMPTDLPKSIVTVRRRGEHSEKPKEFADYLEKHWPSGPFLELFARKPRKGWATFGNDARLWAEDAIPHPVEEDEVPF